MTPWFIFWRIGVVLVSVGDWWVQENKYNVCQVGNGWMRWTVVHEKSNFSFIYSEFLIKFTDPVFEVLTVHPTLLLSNILAGQMFNTFKIARVFWFASNKYGKLFSCRTCCLHSSSFYSAFLPSGALFPFEVIAFIGKAFIIWQYGWQSCFIPRTCHFICNRLALATDNL